MSPDINRDSGDCLKTRIMSFPPVGNPSSKQIDIVEKSGKILDKPE